MIHSSLICECASQRPTSGIIITASPSAASHVSPLPNGMEASNGAIATSVKPAPARMCATRPCSPNENGPGASGSGASSAGGCSHRAHRQAHPIVLGHAAPADESDPRARLQHTARMRECHCRIVEEHHSKAREQDVERSLGQLGAAGIVLGQVADPALPALSRRNNGSAIPLP
jgi:hypothetical protein